MLGELDRSLAAQRQLVADASHELRTPLTSLRTNVELLARGTEVPAEERRAMLGDAVAQIEELTALVGDVVELARGNRLDERPQPVRLDELVDAEVERAARHAPSIRFDTQLEPSTVDAAPSSLARAIANLLDNAAKWSPEDGTVEVGVRDGVVTVRDHGPGSRTPISRVSSTASTGRRRRAVSQDRGSGSRSCARSRRLTEAV